MNSRQQRHEVRLRGLARRHPRGRPALDRPRQNGFDAVEVREGGLCAVV